MLRAVRPAQWVADGSVNEMSESDRTSDAATPLELPRLERPVMLCAFEGWNDAAEAASGAVDHLRDEWSAVEVTALDSEEYYDFQVNRPLVEINESGRRRLTWPTTSLSVARIPLESRDVVLVRGVEPSMRWSHFCQELMGLIDELDVELVVTMGALMADTPHTRPIPITATSNNDQLINELSLEPSTYEGPTGIVGVLQTFCDGTGVPAMSIWAAVPHYVAQSPCPKATLALLHKVEDVLDIAIPLGDLPELARAWEHGVDQLAEEDPEVAEYVRQLEEARDTADLPEASGEAIAREFERYLRRRASDGDR
jgi:proteasome assembly chaperone (PAC2) family protein